MEQEVSTITPTSFILALCFGFLLFVLPRRYALLPLFISGCYMTLGQVLLIGPLHFSIFRIILFFGWVRILFKNELASIKLNSIDRVLILWVVVSSLVYILSRGMTSEVIIGRLGESYNIIGIYFLTRALIWDFDDIVHAFKMLAVIIIPLAIFFILELRTGRNLFSVFGGVPDFTGIRDGRLRCQGPFRHPILAGTFGATVMPLFVGLWAYSPRSRLLAASAIIASTIIVIASASSGPLLAYGAGVVGLICWAFRSKMRAIRWGIVVLLLALHAIMKAPVWFLIDRMSGILGMGSGWYRSALIDAAIRHFNEWWLMGTTYTRNWMPTGLANYPDMADITNQFISEGVNGGLITMILFIWLIVECFKSTGNAAHDEVTFSHSERFMTWSIGCALLGHVASLFSVTYFDQITIFWFLVIATAATLAELPLTVSTIYVDYETGNLSESGFRL